MPPVVGAGAGLGFAGVTRQLDAIDGEHLAADEALPVAEVEHLAEDGGDVIAQARDKGGKSGEVGSSVSREGDEGDLLTAGPFDLAGADDAATVGEEDDLKQQGRWIGGGTGQVIAVAVIKAREINRVVDQPVEGVLKGAGMELPFQINGEEARAGVDGFVAGHVGVLGSNTSTTIDIPFGSRHSAGMNELFLQLR